MTKSRLEAFSDGVYAIIITIMVLELKVPSGHDPGALRPLVPVLLSYLLSYVFIGIYWANHHNLFHAVEKVDGATLWANLHLLFWLSLVPFCTAWLSESGHSLFPMLLYGIVLLGAALAYFVMLRVLAALHGPKSRIARALGSDIKGKLSAALYAASLPLAFLNPWISYGIYVGVALIWLVPDRRFGAA